MAKLVKTSPLNSSCTIFLPHDKTSFNEPIINKLTKRVDWQASRKLTEPTVSSVTSGQHVIPGQDHFFKSYNSMLCQAKITSSPPTILCYTGPRSLLQIIQFYAIPGQDHFLKSYNSMLYQTKITSSNHTILCCTRLRSFLQIIQFYAVPGQDHFFKSFNSMLYQANITSSDPAILTHNHKSNAIIANNLHAHCDTN
jgi:hypothetical protein